MTSRNKSLPCVVLLAIALMLPSAVHARSFESGSLIIPMSREYQSERGILAAYALVYATLFMNSQPDQPQIKVYWAIAPNKLSPYRCDTRKGSSVRTNPAHRPDYSRFNENDGCDFLVERVGGTPVSLLARDRTTSAVTVKVLEYIAGTGPTVSTSSYQVDSSTEMVKYLGGSWIIDSTDAVAFMTRLNDPKFARFSTGGVLHVNIHTANKDFIAPVATILKGRPPKLAVVTGSGAEGKLTDVLINAGLCSDQQNEGFFKRTGSTALTAQSDKSCEGEVYQSYTDNVDALLGSVSNPASGTLNATNSEIGLLWLGDSAFGSTGIPAHQRTEIEKFLNNRGNVFAQYDAVGAMEGLLSTNSGLYQTTAGVTVITAASDATTGTHEDCNDRAGFQLYTGGSNTSGNNATTDRCIIYGGAHLPFAQSGNFYYAEGGNGNWQGFTGTFKLPPTTSPGTYQIAQLAVRESSAVAPEAMIASASYYANDPSKGIIMYQAGHRYDVLQQGRFWGQRLILNTIFARLEVRATEIARSEPVAYSVPSKLPPEYRVYQGTFMEQLHPDVPAMDKYDVADPTIWLFPYTDGHLYQYDLSTLTSTAQAFNFSTQAIDAAAVLKGGNPLPPARNVWTYVQGSAHVGWKKIDFKYTEVTDEGPQPCTKDAQGVCELSRALLAEGNVAGIQATELKGPGDTLGAAQARKLGRLVSQIRGSCVARDTVSDARFFEPLDGDCAPRSSTDVTLPTPNRARLGGIDHSSPAVVGPSRYISDTPWSKRPVVAYAAGYDGMLHAFYVSNWNGLTSAPGWTDATDESVRGLDLLDNVVPMQELWAIVPPGQIGFMWSNDALLDGSLNVVDVFGNFPTDENGDGVIDWTANSAERPKGIRTWRTVLVLTAGKGAADWGIGGSETLALDVTNPLSPVLLWHIGGATENDGRAYNPAGAGSWTAFDASGPPTDPTKFALKWVDSETANYNPTTTTEINALKTGRYDYRNLGLAYNSAVAKIWSGAGYTYAVFIASNAADAPPRDDGTLFRNPWYSTARPQGALRGVQVFGIDIVTGEKIWQWQHLYRAATGPGLDNSVPPRLALGDIDVNGSVDRIYVGDLEGRVWELSARDGRNWNYLKSRNGDQQAMRSFPLFGTEAMTGTGAAQALIDRYKLNGSETGMTQQPITTPIGQARFTAVPSKQRNYLLNRLALVIGTMGVNWPIAEYEHGHVYVLPVSPDMGTRLTEPIDISATRNPLKHGVLLPHPPGDPSKADEHAWWDIALAKNERVFGMPRVVNNTILFNTALGAFAKNVSETLTDKGYFWNVSATMSGSTYVSTATPTENNTKSYAGVLVVGTDVVITTADKIKRVAGHLTQSGDVAASPFNRVTPAALKTWEVVPQ